MESVKQRKLIKGREYAITARKKKKSALNQLSIKKDQLQERLQQLELENIKLKEENRNKLNAQLQERLQQLELENIKLKEENRKLLELSQSSPPPQSSPPLNSTSCSDDSSNFEIDIFEDELFFSSDWTMNNPYILKAVFFCLLFFLPSTMVERSLPQSTPALNQHTTNNESPLSKGNSAGGSHVASLGLPPRRNLFTTDSLCNSLGFEVNEGNSSTSNLMKVEVAFITIEDVLNDELSIKQTDYLELQNVTTSIPFVISNHSFQI